MWQFSALITGLKGPEQPEVIPVEKGLPPEGKRVIVVCRQFRILGYRDDNGFWRRAEAVQGVGRRDRMVRAWFGRMMREGGSQSESQKTPQQSLPNGESATRSAVNANTSWLEPIEQFADREQEGSQNPPITQ